MESRAFRSAWSSLLAGGCWVLCAPGRARAHGTEQHVEAGARALGAHLREWTFDPLVIATLLLATGLYVRGSLRLHEKRRTDPSARPRSRLRLRREDWAFALGVLTLIVALMSPLDVLSDLLFSAHMGQHELLMLVAAPLLVLARPWQAYLAACSPRARTAVTALMRRPAVVRGWRVLTWPAVAVGVHAFVRWIWHAPVLFEAALRSEWIHGVQHATFFGSAAVFWWALLHGRYGRLGYGVSVLFVFATALHTGALGALITFARRALYASHAARTERYALDAMQDQQLAGLLMWIPAGVLLLSVALALFAAWLGEGERRTQRSAWGTRASRLDVIE